MRPLLVLLAPAMLVMPILTMMHPAMPLQRLTMMVVLVLRGLLTTTQHPMAMQHRTAIVAPLAMRMATLEQPTMT
jgi:hypothetical protein